MRFTDARRKVRRSSADPLDTVDIVRGEKRRRLHKAFLRYHDANNWPLLREALKEMGRADLIGNGKHHLIPSFQPATDGAYVSERRKNSTPPSKPSQRLQQHQQSNEPHHGFTSSIRGCDTCSSQRA